MKGKKIHSQVREVISIVFDVVRKGAVRFANTDQSKLCVYNTAVTCDISTKTVQEIRKENRRITLRAKCSFKMPRKFKLGQITIALQTWILYRDTAEIYE
jgi:hypothetical protein